MTPDPTSKPLHCRTTPTMFLPMSWTSPLTVASSIPLRRAFGFRFDEQQMGHGRFMTRADFTTWGKNI